MKLTAVVKEKVVMIATLLTDRVRCHTGSVAFLMSLVIAGGVSAQCEVQQVSAPEGSPSGGFARSLSVDGNRMAVAGEPDANGNSAVYVYLFDADTGSVLPDPIQQFEADLAATPGLRGFGGSISMSSDGLAIAGVLDPDSDDDGIPTVEYRRWNAGLQLFDAFPTRWDPGEYSPSSIVAIETIVCKMGRIELARSSRGRSRGITMPRIMLGGSRGSGVPGEIVVEGFVLDVGGDVLLPRGVITRDAEEGSVVWTSPPDTNTAAALFWDPISPDLGPRLTIFGLNGDVLEPTDVIESDLPAGSIGDLDADGRPDIIVVSGILDPDSDDDSIDDGTLEARIFRRNDQIWSQTDRLSSASGNNPLYSDNGTMVSNPIFEGRALDPTQVFIFARSSDADSSSIDVHVWDVEVDQPAKKVAKFKAGKALADTVKMSGNGNGGAGGGGRIALALTCDCCDDDCDGIVSIIEPNGIDCNGNGVCDDLDIASGISSDADFNGVPDECELPVADLPFGGLVTNPTGIANVVYNAGRDRIEVLGATGGGDDGISTQLGGLPGYAASQRILSHDGAGFTTKFSLTPPAEQNALPILFMLPQIDDEVLCQFDTSNMGETSEIIVHALSGDGSVLETHALTPPYSESLVHMTMPNDLPAVRRCVAGPGNEVDASSPYLYLGVAFEFDGIANIGDTVIVSGVRTLLFELHPDMTGGPLGVITQENPLAQESGWQDAPQLERGIDPVTLDFAIEHQAAVMRDIAVRGRGDALLSGAGEPSPGSLRVDNLGSSGSDGLSASPDSILSAGEPVRNNLEFAIDLTSDPARGATDPQLDVLAKTAAGGDIGYSIVMTGSNMKEVRAMTSGDPIQATIEVLVAGDVVRAFEGIVNDELLATIFFITDWPTSVRIGSDGQEMTNGLVSLTEPLAILIPGREFIDVGDAIRFSFSPVEPSRGEISESGISEASLLGREIEQIIVHDINEGDTTVYCNGDANLDGSVGLADLLAVLSNWGSGPTGDVDGDSSVGLSDLLTVLSNWGCTSE